VWPNRAGAGIRAKLKTAHMHKQQEEAASVKGFREQRLKRPARPRATFRSVALDEANKSEENS
jgi:hypothetical protein